VASVVRHARAATYPDRVIRLIVPFGPGSGTDVIGRAAAQAMGMDLGTSFTVENRPGADGVTGSSFVAHAPADGCTLLIGANGPLVTAPIFHPELAYDPARDLAPVAMLARLNFVLIVPAQSPVKTVADLVALAKSQQSEAAFGTPGIATAAHLAAALFEQAVGVTMRLVPATATMDVMTALTAGRLDCVLTTLPIAMGPMKAGQVRALAVGGLKRSSLVPDLPTIAESGYPGYDAETWVTIMAPAGIPADVATALSDSAAKAVASAKMKMIMTELGAEPNAMGPGQLADYLVRERGRWRALIEAMGLAHRP
jgi:tripartite-type tricarboxylate transporter receptor subunit TctC